MVTSSRTLWGNFLQSCYWRLKAGSGAGRRRRTGHPGVFSPIGIERLEDRTLLSAIRAGFNSNTLPANDDGSTGPVSLGFSGDIDFFGVTHGSLFVNNNGNVTFDAPLSSFTPFNLTSTSREIIAPFFGDVDTRFHGAPVTYGAGTVSGRDAFGVNWINVDYFASNSAHGNQLNSF